MNSDPLQKIDFQNRLAYFGGAITANPSEAQGQYQDLEQFVVDATQMMSYDVRVTQCFLNWLIRYGVLLCPSKIRRLLKTCNYDQAILGVFLMYLMKNDPHPKRWSLLKKYTKKNLQGSPLFSHLPAPINNTNEYFKKYGILVQEMKPHPEKYLLPAEAVLKRCPEIAHRGMMIGTVASDLLSLIQKEPTIKSAYKIAKKIHHHRAQVYSVVKTMEQVGNKIF